MLQDTRYRGTSFALLAVTRSTADEMRLSQRGIVHELNLPSSSAPLQSRALAFPLLNATRPSSHLTISPFLIANNTSCSSSNPPITTKTHTACPPGKDPSPNSASPPPRAPPAQCPIPPPTHVTHLPHPTPYAHSNNAAQERHALHERYGR